MNAPSMIARLRLMAAAVLLPSLMAVAQPTSARDRSSCRDCGTVVTTNRKDEKGSGTAGTVIGGVGGAVAGNVLGHDTTSTVLGGVGGAVAGNVIGKKVGTKKVWSVQVRMDDGTTREVDFSSEPRFREGDRVRVRNGTLARL